MPLPGLLDHSQGRTGCGAIAFKPAFCKLEQKGLGSRDKTLGSVFADRHHLAEYGLIGCFAMTTPRTAGRIAALALCKARRPWRLAITDAIIFGIVRRSAPKSHSLVPPRPTQTIRIARATSYMIGGQAMAVAPRRAAEPPKAQAGGAPDLCASPDDRGCAPRSQEGGEPHLHCRNRLNARSEALGSCSASHASRFMIHFTTSRAAIRLPARASR